MGYINFKEEKYKAKNQLQNRQSNNKKLTEINRYNINNSQERSILIIQIKSLT